MQARDFFHKTKPRRRGVVFGVSAMWLVWAACAPGDDAAASERALEAAPARTSRSAALPPAGSYSKQSHRRC